MDNNAHLLALNSTEGVLQLAIGAVPQRLVSACGVADSGDGVATFSIAGMGRKGTRRNMVSSLKCSQEWRLPSQGAELLAPALRDIMARIGIGPDQLTHIACVTGPGSFTGIRLTTTSAGGLAMATGALMGGIPYLPLLAQNALSLMGPVLPPGGIIWVVTHARRDLVHAQSFRYGLASSPPIEELTSGDCAAPWDVTPHSQVLVVDLDELVSLVSAEGVPVILLGSGITRNKGQLLERFASVSHSPVFLHEAFDMPQASVLFDMACSVRYGKEELMPEYLRASDAEESLSDIALKLGLDAEEVLAAYAAFQRE